MIPVVRVHEIPVVVMDKVVGAHTLCGGSSALTSCPVRSWELLAEIEGWTARHPAGWDLPADAEKQVSQPG